jgi:hypothetical protein
MHFVALAEYFVPEVEVHKRLFYRHGSSAGKISCSLASDSFSV